MNTEPQQTQQTQTVAGLVKELVANAKTIAEEAAQIPVAAESAFKPHHSDGRGKNRGELEEAKFALRRLVLNVREKQTAIENIASRLNGSSQDLDAAFRLVDAIRFIKK